MKSYLKIIVNQLRNYNLALDIKSILIDKPWALIDEDSEIQKLIFKSNKELILSKNGQVQIGSWEYFPEAKSLMINRNVDKILCNEAFIDKGVMILKLDGTDNNFFILANENLVPDLDAIKYLKELRYQKLKIAEKKLVDGEILEIQREDFWLVPQIGNNVTIDGKPIENGKYQLVDNNQCFEVKNSKIFKILHENKYKNTKNQEITVQQQHYSKIKYGDYVFMYGKQVDSGIIDFSYSKNLIVRNGIVIRLERKDKFLRWLYKNWNILLGNYME